MTDSRRMSGVGQEKYIENIGGKARSKETNQQDQDIAGRITLRWIWLRIGAGGGLL
jgi:hypothetical protein